MSGLRKVIKLDVPGEKEFTWELPRDSQFLTVQAQSNEPVAWWLISDDTVFETRRFRMHSTDEPISGGDQLDHLGTFLLYDGFLVFHLFEQRRSSIEMPSLFAEGGMN